MKKEWFFWPMGILMRRLGGIPVYRSKQMHSTDIIAEQAKQAKKFRLCITPEGTRKAQPEWKKGFYYIALKAEIPILLYGLDFADRKIVCTKTIVPNGDIEAPGDMVIYVAGYPAIYGKQPLYFKDPVFQKRAAIAAPSHSDRLPRLTGARP